MFAPAHTNNIAPVTGHVLLSLLPVTLRAEKHKLLVRSNERRMAKLMFNQTTESASAGKLLGQI